MTNIDQSCIEDENQKASASFRDRNKELYTRDHPIIRQLRNDSDQQNVVQKLHVPSQVVESLSHTSESSLSLEGMEITLRTKVEDAKFVKLKARDLFYQFMFLSNQDLLYDSKSCNNFSRLQIFQKSNELGR